ncbi:peroxiredoxin [Arthrobacter sp. MYb211]|uniref:redoxin domain-containing protein n=1 Tax=unclassified Arthrobacter TaxID=235627 RepID=UPI000CFC033E|nr:MULTISPECIES: redoxin domain-containing protein [unclassified Arthrobacter]PRA14008.1 peroxiredoxin [Arthrobacter sp. MYb221]PRC06637.1 peroxiredoxin [Arthrobacter sp. MYb211]
MIETGSRLFDFSLENQYGETITSTQLASGRVLVVFYPWAFSRVCGSELAEIQEHHQLFSERQVRVCAISVDHKFTLRSYAESLGIEFDLLADFWPHGAVARLAGAFDEEKGVATRLTLYLVDGVVQDVMTSSMTEPRSLESYFEAVKRSR